MPRILPGDGPQPSPILIVGERPGGEELDNYLRDHQSSPYTNFIGRAGDELWARLERCCHIERDQCRVVNLVPTFSIMPPSPTEISHYAYLLDWELRHTKPRYILAVGYHAARALLPQFTEVTGDYFHGLAFPVGRRVRGCDLSAAVVVPSCHSAAALREPEMYQNQLTNDLRAFGQALHGDERRHHTRAVRISRVGLAGFGKEGQWLGLDTEGSTTRPECVTLAKSLKEAACVETWDNHPSPFLRPAILHSRVAIHYAVHDWQVLLTLGIDLSLARSVHCTMLQAQLLGYPQSLKVLAFRQFGYQMSEYADLVQPLDSLLVRKVLGECYEKNKAHRDHQQRRDQLEKARTRKHARARRAGTATDVDSRVRPRGAPDGRQTEIPGRALASLKGILTKDTQATPRARWESSTFTALVPLPPAPTWKDLPEPVRIPYAMTDAVAHLHAHTAHVPELRRRGLLRTYSIDRAMIPWLVENERVGLACDKDALEALSAQFQHEFDRTCSRINHLAGYDVNPISGDQVSDCLFLDRGVTRTRLTKSHKRFTTADKYLKARKNEDILIPLVLTARQLNKYLGTYTKKLPDLLLWDEATQSWRYHPRWKYTRTPTGRWAESIIVLIPKHDPMAIEEGRMNRATAIRNCFYATTGHRLVSCDLSQIEMRCMAHVSQDPVLLDVYKKGLDIHSSTAHHVLGAPRKREQQDESKHRLPAKTFNFSIINGVTEFGLLDQLNELHCTKANGEAWEIDSVREFRTEWFRVHKGVERFWDLQKAQARRRGEVRDLFGRRRQISKLWSTDERIVKEGERECLFGIQAAADTISKIWNKRMWKTIIQPRKARGEYCEPWVRVHDDTTFETDRKQAGAVARAMLAAVPDVLCIPTLAEAKVGRRWGSLEKLEKTT